MLQESLENLAMCHTAKRIPSVQRERAGEEVHTWHSDAGLNWGVARFTLCLGSDKNLKKTLVKFSLQL